MLKTLPGVYPQFRVVLFPLFEYKYRTQTVRSRRLMAVDSVLCWSAVFGRDKGDIAVSLCVGLLCLGPELFHGLICRSKQMLLCYWWQTWCSLKRLQLNIHHNKPVTARGVLWVRFRTQQCTWTAEQNTESPHLVMSTVIFHLSTDCVPSVCLDASLYVCMWSRVCLQVASG